MKLPANKIAEILGVRANSGDDTIITTLLTDSRDLAYPAETAFFALRTPGNDGHKYVNDLYAKGVRHFVVDTDDDAFAELVDATVWVVPNVLNALQDIAIWVRSQFDIPVVGITGSRGKTIVKEMLYDALKGVFDITRSPRSYNSQIGVPLSIWEMTPETNLGIFEAGISQPGEMMALHQMIRPTIGVFTSLTDEHADGFQSIEDKAREKARLFSSFTTVFYDATSPLIAQAINQCAAGCTLVPVAGGNRALALAVAEHLLSQYTTLPYSVTGIQRQLAGEPDRLVPRFDVCETLKGCQVVYDAFTNDLRSIFDALNFQRRRMAPGQHSTVILANTEGSYDWAELGRMLTAKGVSRFIGVGFDKGQLVDIKQHAADTNVSGVDTVEEFVNTHTISDFDNEVILVKGTPSDGFDDIKSLLEEPRHETVMEVDLGAIANNFNYFRSLMPAGEGLVAMVKADGYGVGSLELSKVMQSQGAAYLAVAVVDEGVTLRRAGITMPIIVMNPLGTNYKALFDNRLEPSVFSLRELHLLLDNAARLGVKNYPVHIKLDTGMHRLGFVESEIPALLEVLNSQSYVKVRSIFSHLATADCLDQNTYTEGQLETFARMSQTLTDGLQYKPLRHILNTAGMLRYPQYHYDMARLGIGLYGISPLPPEDDLARKHLQVVARLFSTIISIKEWDAGTTIGYGRRGVIGGPTTIATVPIGYADGLDRHLSNGNAYFLVNGHRCPIVGNICMDQCMIDVTGADANIGDKVEIFGENLPIERLSDTLGTIPYEILTSISPRVKRIYFRG